MIDVTPGIRLQEHELHFDFVRSSGPGGQNVNRVATAVQLRFDAAHSPSLPDDVRQRLLRQQANRVTSDGVLIIDARNHRTQERNRAEAVDRLCEVVRRASVRPRPRHKTKPSRAARERRLHHKRQHGQKKRLRGRVRPDDG
jgi:ribosome-associated protein